MLKTYEVKTVVEHDGERFEPGASIKLESKHADPLLAVVAIGAFEPKAKEAAAEDKGGKSKSERGGLPLGDAGN